MSREKKRRIIRQLLEEYEIVSAKDIHEALKDRRQQKRKILAFCAE